MSSLQLTLGDLDPIFAKIIRPIKDKVMVWVGTKGEKRSLVVTELKTTREIVRKTSKISSQKQAWKFCSAEAVPEIKKYIEAQTNAKN